MIRTLRSRVALAAAGTVVLLAAGGGATAALAAPSDGAPAPTTTTAACRVHLRAELLGAMPAELQQDLRALRAEPVDQRADERRTIRRKALAGAYGPKVERVAHLVADARKDGTSVWASLPEALQADLKDLRATEPGSAERKAEAREIEQKALSGGYGTTVQHRAEQVQQRFQDYCAALPAK